MLGVTKIQLLGEGWNGKRLMRTYICLSTGVKQSRERRGRKIYLRLSVGGRGKEGVEALLLEEVGRQAGEAVSGVEGDLNEQRESEREETI